MHVSRRNLLCGAAALPLAVALAGCAGQTPSSVVAITQQAIADAQNIEAAVAAALKTSGVTIPSSINTYLTEAETALAGLNVGALVSPTTVTAIFTDLSTALADAQTILPGNSYLAMAQLVLTALQVAWGLVAPKASATLTASDLHNARVKLSTLPRFILHPG